MSSEKLNDKRSAVVLGASGILGREIVRTLAAEQQNWHRIYAFSHRSALETSERVQTGALDLRSSSSVIASVLQDVHATHLFYAAYIGAPEETEECRINGDMLDNLLEAISHVRLIKTLERFILVAGGMQYSINVGRAKNPMSESDPWLSDPNWPANMYHRQQRSLFAFCERNAGISWTVTYPNDVIGVANGNFMNLTLSLGVYAAVTKELGQDLVWPGNTAFYSSFNSFTSSRLHAEFCSWAALNPAASNQAFNVANGDVQTFENIWSLLANHFGIKVQADQFLQSELNPLVQKMSVDPPIAYRQAELGLVGTINQAVLRNRINLKGWSQSPKVREAWTRLATRENLELDALDKATWDFLGSVLGRDFSVVMSMSKARKAGWMGYVDTWESFVEAFNQLQQASILPRRLPT